MRASTFFRPGVADYGSRSTRLQPPREAVLVLDNISTWENLCHLARQLMCPGPRVGYGLPLFSCSAVDGDPHWRACPTMRCHFNMSCSKPTTVQAANQTLARPACGATGMPYQWPTCAYMTFTSAPLRHNEPGRSLFPSCLIPSSPKDTEFCTCTNATRRDRRPTLPRPESNLILPATLERRGGRVGLSFARPLVVTVVPVVNERLLRLIKI